MDRGAPRLFLFHLRSLDTNRPGNDRVPSWMTQAAAGAAWLYASEASRRPAHARCDPGSGGSRWRPCGGVFDPWTPSLPQGFSVDRSAHNARCREALAHFNCRLSGFGGSSTSSPWGLHFNLWPFREFSRCLCVLDAPQVVILARCFGTNVHHSEPDGRAPAPAAPDETASSSPDSWQSDITRWRPLRGTAGGPWRAAPALASPDWAPWVPRGSEATGWHHYGAVREGTRGETP
jgi:hypothetical protein